MKIEWAKQYGTAQVYYDGIEMALCSEDGRQIGPWVFCKDFFQDAIKGYLNGISSSIHGYVYDPKTQPPIDMENARVLMTDANNPQYRQKIADVLDLLNRVEKDMGLEPTVALECKNPPSKYEKAGVFLFVGDKAWLQSSAALSMWTLLMRNGVVHKSGDAYQHTLSCIIIGKTKPAQSNDHIYLKWARPGIDLVIKQGIEKVFGKDIKKNYAASIPTHILHHNGGIVSFGAGKTQGTWPHWLQPIPLKEQAPYICFG
jgi:hypothetical protein